MSRDSFNESVNLFIRVIGKRKVAEKMYTIHGAVVMFISRKPIVFPI